MIVLKNKEEIDKIRTSCGIVVEALMKMSSAVEPGISTYDLDRIAEEVAIKNGAKPAFKGYRDYPSSVCFALNEEVVHGIPSKNKVLKNGDIIGMDFGVLKNGYFGDSAVTVPVGDISSKALGLLDVTRQSLYRGIEKTHPNNKLYEVSHAIQSYVENNGYSIVKTFVGHGISYLLTLSLLMFFNNTDNPNNTFSFNYLTFITHFPYRRPDFQLKPPEFIF